MLSTAGLTFALLMQAFAWPRLEIRPIRSGPVLGTADGDELTLFSWVRAASRLESGPVLIADAGNARVVLFSKTGKPIWSSGRRGDGPGEYRFLNSVARCVNGPWAAHDGNQGRLTFLSDSGLVISTRVLPSGPRARMVWCSGRAEQAVMWRQDIFIPQSAGSFRMPVVLLRIGLNDRIDTLAMEQNEWFSVPLGRGGTSFETPLARPVFAAAAGKTAWLCLAREGKCSVHDLESGTRDTISIGIPQRPLSASAWASALRDSSERPPIRSRDPERSTSAILEMLPRPETFPRFARMQADATDRLWVQTYEHHDVSAATWLVVTRQGSAVARVQLPAGLKPLEIGRGFLLGLTVDSDGVERVSSYTFKPIP